jgi:hypothetical protein
LNEDGVMLVSGGWLVGPTGAARDLYDGAGAVEVIPGDHTDYPLQLGGASPSLRHLLFYAYVPPVYSHGPPEPGPTVAWFLVTVPEPNAPLACLVALASLAALRRRG